MVERNRPAAKRMAGFPLYLDPLPVSNQGGTAFVAETVPEVEMYPVTPLHTRPRRQRYAPEQGVRKIAVLRSNAIGDFMFALPALEALRHTYPGAEIVLLGLDWHAEFLRGRPGPVDRVEVIPPSEGLNLMPGQQADPSAVDAFFKRMQAEKFDLALQFHGGGRYSNPFTRRLGARLTAGARTSDADPLDRWIPYAPYQLETLRVLEIASLVGAEPVCLEPRLEVTARDLEEANALISPSGSPLVVIHPAATDPRRRWPVEKFAAVGNALKRVGAQVVVIGVESDRNLAERLTGLMDGETLNLCGRTSLAGLVGLLSRADLLVSNDSGPVHLAAAVGTPTVSIYWVGNLVTSGLASHSLHRQAVSWRMDCPVCGQDCMLNNCEHQESFVADVPETEITSSALELLERYG